MSAADNLDSEGRYWRIQKWFPDLSDETVANLRAYHSELIYFNGRMNLISPRTEKNADLIHIADGILGSRIILGLTKQKMFYDIGSGNGTPGLILALMDPSRQVKLIDTDARKIEFLKHCIGRLGLKNCSTVQARLEDLEEGSLMCAVTRGFATISKSLLLSRKSAGVGCEFFHFKGRSWSSELAEIPSQVLASWDPKHVNDYQLPETETIMSIVMTTRVGK
jgi:16S rRNA (guanine527-N7)-methyltransferase